MRTADLCDLSDLVDGLSRDMCRKWGFRTPRSDRRRAKVPEFVSPVDISDESAVAAIDAVLATYPGAVWITADGHGRVIDGDRLISVAIPLTDPDAEHVGWLEASTRLGPVAGR